MTRSAPFVPEKQVMRTPRSVDIEITSRCNLRCRYCYYFDNPDVAYGDLPTESWLRFFDELGRCAVMDATFQGGEPFIRKDFPELIAGVVRNRMRFSILTNGALISDEIAEFIAGTGRCDSIQVSVDGATPETHDALRGKGAFMSALGGIRTLRRHGICPTVRVTVHRHNVRDLRNIARLLLDDLGLPGFTTNAAAYLGSCRSNAGDIILDRESRQIAMETLVRLAGEYGGRITASAGPLAEALMWRRMEQARIDGLAGLPHCGGLTACGCADSKIAVRSDGTIIACCMLPGMELGGINRDSLAEVWQNSPELNRFRQRKTISLDTFDFCAGCPYIAYCTGNCPGTAVSLTGRAEHPSPDACLRRFLDTGGKIPDEHLFTGR